MSRRRRGAGLAVVGIVIGALGGAFIAFGLLGMFTPDALTFAPVLREPVVGNALVISGAVLLVVEMVVVLAWVRQRQGR